MRIVSVWLPSWPTLRLHRLGHGAPDKPLATVEPLRGGRVLASVSAAAEAMGLRNGQGLAEARAICPALDVIEADPAADRAALRALAGWCERYTPLAAPDAPEGLWLDIAGCAHLFSGESALGHDLAARLARNGLPCRIAIAGTPAAAWALARSATARDQITVLPPGQEKSALAMLSVSLLRLDPRVVAGLRRVGLKTIGELARQPRSDVSVRFGPAPTLRLDQAFGAAAEAIAWPRPPVEWLERLAFAEPIGTRDDLTRGLALLTQQLCTRLEAAGRGGTRFTAHFYRVDEGAPTIRVATAQPARDAAHIVKLLNEKLETVDPGFGVEVMTLEAEETAKLATPQTTLSDIGKPSGGALATTVDTLTNRLGPRRVWRTTPRSSHIPERAVRRLPGLAKCPAWEADPSIERPLRLLRRPEPIEATAPLPDDLPLQFRWRRALHRVRTASGPERIGGEWWRRQGAAGDEPTRDYYRVEDSSGGRFWVFRAGDDGTQNWFLHGLFG